MPIARPIRSLSFVLLAVLAVWTVAPVDAQESLDDIREERRRIEAEEADKAREVDAQAATLGELNAALEVLQANVNAQEARVSDAERRLLAAEAVVHNTNIRIAQLEADVTNLSDRAARQAIGSFVEGTRDQPSALMATDDVNEAVWARQIMETVTDQDTDALELLRVTEEDLALERRLADDAEAEAELIRDELALELAELEADRNAQAEIAAEAEARLEHLLFEQAALEAEGAELAAAEQEELERLAELARRAAAEAPAAPSGGSTPPIPSSGEIVSVRGFQVHQSIASNVAAMIDAASAAGHSLGGGGYRSSASQIALRRAHCGTSNYAIYEMPSSQCSPPTARPGASMHERGLALDLTCSGSLIRSRSNSCFQWLAANASSYGFFNLPSEPWHWSTNGR